MSARRTRPNRRIPQACDNCRRKKIRCPGERPSCSTCIRLEQACCYADGDPRGDQITARLNGDVADRLTQLEDKLDMILDRVEGSPRQGITPSTSGRRASILHTSPATTQPGITSSAPLPAETIERAIAVYFKSIHRQPLFLFDSGSSVSANSNEELLCVILALSTRYNSAEFADTELQSPELYSNAARKLIMLKIADETVCLQTLQAVCLLAFFNLVSGDLSTAGFHIGLAKSLMQCSTLDSQGSRSRAPSLGDQSKLFWSIFLLDTICGTPVMVPSTAEDIHAPRFLSVQETTQSTFIPCPLLPQDSFTTAEDMMPGAWAHMVRMCSIWGEVRFYVSRCTQGLVHAPWRPDSDYTRLNARLLDLEVAYPRSLRYDRANFLDRESGEIQSDREYWLTWFRIQLTYHTFHSVLNHPFLYSFRAAKQKFGANAFWRTSSELALRHSTWIARLIDMANQKGVELADPFFAQSASIAATLHFYWARSDDVSVQNSAARDLETCRSLTTKMAASWPICRSIAEALAQFIDHTNASSSGPSNETDSTLAAAKTSLMWRILDIAAPQFPSFSDERLLQPRTHRAPAFEDRQSSQEYTTLEGPEIHTPPADVRDATGNYASPPRWLSPRVTNASVPNNGRQSMQENQQAPVLGSLNGMQSDQAQPFSDNLNFSWGPYEPWMQPGDKPAVNLDWWDMSNL